jgi:hypothetical protein
VSNNWKIVKNVLDMIRKFLWPNLRQYPSKCLDDELIFNNTTEHYMTTGEAANHTPTRKSANNTKKPTSLL